MTRQLSPFCITFPFISSIYNI